ncbi:hypothetical protein BPT24_218 [Tenacibaculum phage pT24]|uniref:Uncharacterized protein n=1 Tax=Tenacibaculum phage pT24 TaxID=1880590 RepID=A0A1B4XWZ8_9CAUD|nr:hypothetical protein HYP10_gp218 [Tenacibaculum phage pT24]BAV39342.1 hypothetical protein BPT24_218 [Tenacibaculum phage pT24]
MYTYDKDYKSDIVSQMAYNRTYMKFVTLVFDEKCLPIIIKTDLSRSSFEEIIVWVENIECDIMYFNGKLIKINEDAIKLKGVDFEDLERLFPDLLSEMFPNINDFIVYYKYENYYKIMNKTQEDIFFDVMKISPKSYRIIQHTPYDQPTVIVIGGKNYLTREQVEEYLKIDLDMVSVHL